VAVQTSRGGVARFEGVDPTPTLREPGQRVSPRARLMWQLSNLVEGLVTVAILVAAAAVWDAVDLTWWMVVLGLLAVAGYVAIVPQWRYLVHRWEVTETAVYTQTGWWARERRIAPMSRIQTVDYAESPVARLFGLATVTVTTASAAGALQIAGLDKVRARELVDELTLKADAVEGDAT
jgi:membrane protein YdbS with pleckstrin-like domain